MTDDGFSYIFNEIRNNVVSVPSQPYCAFTTTLIEIVNSAESEAPSNQIEIDFLIFGIESMSHSFDTPYCNWLYSIRSISIWNS